MQNDHPFCDSPLCDVTEGTKVSPCLVTTQVLVLPFETVSSCSKHVEG